MANAMVSKGSEYKSKILNSLITNLSALYYMFGKKSAKKRAEL